MMEHVYISYELTKKKHGGHRWRCGYALASHLCDPGSIPVVSVSCGLSLLLVFALLRGFFSGFSGFPLSAKTNRSKFQSILMQGLH